MTKKEKKAMEELIRSQIRQAPYEERRKNACLQLRFSTILNEDKPYEKGQQVAKSFLSDPWELKPEECRDFAEHFIVFAKGLYDELTKAETKADCPS